jgi:hypothetical protein
MNRAQDATLANRGAIYSKRATRVGPGVSRAAGEREHPIPDFQGSRTPSPAGPLPTGPSDLQRGYSGGRRDSTKRCSTRRRRRTNPSPHPHGPDAWPEFAARAAGDSCKLWPCELLRRKSHRGGAAPATGPANMAHLKLPDTRVMACTTRRPKYS